MDNEKKAARNSLASSRSPYLLQHASNPVDWREWGEAAFSEARERGVPIFLSVGYSTCHWCHVMARESFEDETIGRRLNELFVNIKVDREERPDVDRIYMSYVQSVSGSGGWPMSVWLTPDLKPFYGGTYFPPEDRYGRVGFPTLIERIGELWEEDRTDLLQHGEKSLELLVRNAGRDLGEGIEAAPQAIDQCLEELEQEFDELWGGFGNAPKFPMPGYLQILLEGVSRRGNARLTEMLVVTLEKMADGGIWDHVGGGFHRYSVDRYWHVPHYEKMLYDQGQLAAIYADAFRLTGHAKFREISEKIVDYVLRDLRGQNGELFAAEDADSADPLDPTVHKEGAFYTWRKDELDTILDTDAALFYAAFNVRSGGNARPESDPHGELAGVNTLTRETSAGELGKTFGLGEKEFERKIADALRRLKQARETRPRPHLDDKSLVSWSGLMISGACRVYQASGYAPALKLASEAAAFLWTTMWDDADHSFRRVYRSGCGTQRGFAEDYASAANAFLDLYESGFDPVWLERARETLDQLCNRFLDTQRGGFFATEDRGEGVLLRLRDDYDGAEPSASSQAAVALLRLAAITDDERLRDLGRRTVEAFGGQWSHTPRAMPLMLVAASRFLEGDQQIVIVGQRGEPLTEELLIAANRRRLPHSVLVFLPRDGELATIWRENEKLRSMRESVPAGETRAFVCENFACKEPVSSVDALESLLR